MKSVAQKRSYNALRDQRIADVESKGGFTYLGQGVNSIDEYRYAWTASDEHTYFLKALGWIVFACTCDDFYRRHRSCKHCDALQGQLWSAELRRRRRVREMEARRTASQRGCWAEEPTGSGCHVWLDEFGLTEKELYEMRAAQECSNAPGLDDERSFRRASYDYT